MLLLRAEDSANSKKIVARKLGRVLEEAGIKLAAIVPL